MSNNQNVKEEVKALLSKEPAAGKNLGQLAKGLNIQGRLAKDMLAAVLEEMMADGSLEFLKDGSYGLPNEKKFVSGKVDFVNPNFAFIVCGDDEPDVFIKSEDMMYALHGDLVKVLLYPDKRKKGSAKNREGEVAEILERGTNEYVGKVDLLDKYAFILPDSRKMYTDIFVHKRDLMDAKSNDKVIVEVMEWPGADKNPVGKVTQILGQAGENDAEMHSILAEFGLPIHFPEEVAQAAEAIPEKIPAEEYKNRRDMRDILTLTIDPEDAKDFDDAISFQKLPNGNYEVGVHIADVTYYLKPETVLDEEAYARATSVYLVDRTVPMLPEKLSNNMCSLRPNEDRLAFSAIFEMKTDGEIVNEWYGRCVIHSDRRFSYEQAQELLEGQKTEEPYSGALLELNRIAKLYKEDRFAQGAIGFETVEVKFKLDEKGKPLGVIPKVRKDAHKLVEEYMLLANRKVANFVRYKKKGKQPLSMIYRVHEQPDYEKLRTFSKFARRFGYTIKTEGKLAISHSLNAMLSDIEGTEKQSFLSGLAIRTMSKARYTSEDLGHFGLAFEHYSHFTSPIRRYPDVITHRLLQHYLDGGKSIDAEEIEAQSKHSSDRERLATDAERASIKYKQVEYILMQPEDKIYEGVVSGMSEWGIYVQMTENLCEGMVRLSDLKDDFYELDQDNYRLVGKRSKRIIGFGDSLKVKVISTDLERRTIDLELILDGNGPTQKPNRRAKRKKR